MSKTEKHLSSKIRIFEDMLLRSKNAYEIETLRRYFTATMAAIVNAQYHINRNLQLRGYTTINEFYDFLGLNGIKYGDEIAWAMDDLMEGGIMWLDFENHRTVMEDGLECCVISAVWNPNKFDGELDIS